MKPGVLAEIAKRLIDLVVEGNEVNLILSDRELDGKDYKVEIKDISVSDGRGGDGRRNVRIWFDKSKEVKI